MHARPWDAREEHVTLDVLSIIRVDMPTSVVSRILVERMSPLRIYHALIPPVFRRADAVPRLLQKVPYEISDFVAEGLAKNRPFRLLVLENGRFRLLAVLSAEGCEAPKALEQDDADAPPVAASVVPVAPDDLGSHVLAGADDAAGQLPTQLSQIM